MSERITIADKRKLIAEKCAEGAEAAVRAFEMVKYWEAAVATGKVKKGKSIRFTDPKTGESEKIGYKKVERSKAELVEYFKAIPKIISKSSGSKKPKEPVKEEGEGKKAYLKRLAEYNAAMAEKKLNSSINFKKPVTAIKQLQAFFEAADFGTISHNKKVQNLPDALWCVKNGIYTHALIVSLFSRYAAHNKLQQYAKDNVGKNNKSKWAKRAGADPLMRKHLEKTLKGVKTKKGRLIVLDNLAVPDYATIASHCEANWNVGLPEKKAGETAAEYKKRCKTELDAWDNEYKEWFEKVVEIQQEKANGYEAYTDALEQMDGSPSERLVAVANLHRDSEILAATKPKSVVVKPKNGKKKDTPQEEDVEEKDEEDDADENNEEEDNEEEDENNEEEEDNEDENNEEEDNEDENNEEEDNEEEDNEEEDNEEEDNE